MKMEITFKGGAHLEVDVESITTRADPVTSALESLKWTNPAGASRRLNFIKLSDVLAIVAVHDGGGDTS